MKNIILSLKCWGWWCLYASFSLLISSPWEGSIFCDILLVIAAVIVCIKANDKFELRMLCVSVIMSSAYCLISYYCDKNNIISLNTNVDYKLNYIFWFIASMSPLIYNFIKTNELYIKIAVVIVGVTFLSGFFFPSYERWDVFSILFTFVIIGFFLCSALDTNDQITRKISLLACLGGFLMMIYYINLIVWYFCDKPEYDGITAWLGYDIDKYPIFHFCMEYGLAFRWMLLISCVLISTYYFHLLKRSKYTLKAVCIPAIIAIVLSWFTAIVNYAPIYFLRYSDNDPPLTYSMII